jgi:ferredoxin
VGAAGFSVTLELPNAARRTISASADESILAAARRNGVRLPSRCEQGWDLACAARVLQGTVSHRRARRYYPQDAAAGFALICVATPCSDVVLRTHESAAMRRHREAHGLPAPTSSTARES